MPLARDAILQDQEGRSVLRFERTLRYPPERVWSADRSQRAALLASDAAPAHLLAHTWGVLGRGRGRGQAFAHDFHSSRRRSMSAARSAASLPSSTAMSPASARR
jgi:hypothetical protein